MGLPQSAQADETAVFPNTHDSPVYLTFGLGFTYIDESLGVDYFGDHYRMTVDSAVYPILRWGYRFSSNWSLESGFRWELFNGHLDQAGTSGSGSPRGATLLLGPVYTGKVFHIRQLGALRPMAHIQLGYSLLLDQPDFPINGFDPALSGEIAIGLQWKRADLRLGYRHVQLKVNHVLPEADPDRGSNILELSGVFVEFAYRFNLPLTK